MYITSLYNLTVAEAKKDEFLSREDIPDPPSSISKSRRLEIQKELEELEKEGFPKQSSKSTTVEKVPEKRPGKDFQRPDEWVDQDPYNVRGKPKQEAARELLSSDEEKQTKLLEQEGFGSFTQEQKVELESRGFEIYKLTGISMADMQDKIEFATNVGPDFVKNLKSSVGEVAVVHTPGLFFLSNSSQKTLAEQQEIIDLFSARLSSDIPGVKAIIGEAADYIAIADQDSRIQDERSRLFGLRYAGSIRTSTTRGRYRSEKLSLARGMKKELHVMFWGDDLNQFKDLFVAPLIIPNNDRT